MKIVINDIYGVYGLSKEAYKYLGLEWDGFGFAFSSDRANPKLVECVETLGQRKASGSYASLRVVEIPDGVEWVVMRCDAEEWVAEKHRTWR